MHYYSLLFGTSIYRVHQQPIATHTCAADYMFMSNSVNYVHVVGFPELASPKRYDNIIREVPSKRTFHEWTKMESPLFFTEKICAAEDELMRLQKRQKYIFVRSAGGRKVPYVPSDYDYAVLTFWQAHWIPPWEMVPSQWCRFLQMKWSREWPSRRNGIESDVKISILGTCRPNGADATKADENEESLRKWLPCCCCCSSRVCFHMSQPPWAVRIPAGGGEWLTNKSRGCLSMSPAQLNLTEVGLSGMSRRLLLESNSIMKNLNVPAISNVQHVALEARETV